MAGPFASVLCVGGIALDRIARTQADVPTPGASNIGVARSFPGGVARNVAEALARLGVPVSLAGCVGADADGARLLAETAAAGVDTALVRSSGAGRTATYTSVFDGSGDLVIGVADMAIVEAVPPDWILQALAARADALVFVDANLSPTALAAVFGAGRRVVAGAVSPQKAVRLSPHLRAVDALFLNHREAAALAPTATGDLLSLAGSLARRGAPRGAVTGGASGAVAWDGERVSALPVRAMQPVSANGAGDTLIAGALAAWRTEDDFIAAMASGLAAAALTLASERAVSPLLAPALRRRARS